MNRVYKALSHHPLAPAATFEQPAAPSERVRPESSALEVMTDLRKVAAATIDPEAPLEAANRFMIRRGVRLLLVANNQREVLGLIAAPDILGERPVKFATEMSVPRRDILVRDIMTPREQLEVLSYTEVAAAEVGHIIATLKASERQHALVARPGNGETAEVVLGIFSLSQIARQLGIDMTSGTEIAHTFAEIEAALGH